MDDEKPVYEPLVLESTKRKNGKNWIRHALYIFGVILTSILSYFFGHGVFNPVREPVRFDPPWSPSIPATTTLGPAKTCRSGKIIPLGSDITAQPSDYFLELCKRNTSYPAIYDQLSLRRSDSPAELASWKGKAWSLLVKKIKSCEPYLRNRCRLQPGLPGEYCPHKASPTPSITLCLDQNFDLYSLRLGYIRLNTIEATVFIKAISYWNPV